MEHENAKARPRGGRVADLLEIFEAPDEPPVEATADDLVSLSIDSRLRVRAVSIRGLDLAADDTARLERAVATAVDRAVREAIRRNSARLIQGIFRRQDRAAAPPNQGT
jgi:hypothetical protein